MGFPCSSVGKKSACNAGDPGSIYGSGRSPGDGNGNPLQYSCLEKPMDRGAWQATVHGATRVGHDLATKPPLWYYSWEKNLCLSGPMRFKSMLFKSQLFWIHETSAQGWCTGKTQRDGWGGRREGGSGWGTHANSCQCMAKTTTIL